ncbi:MAG TPA: alpha/beta fold hydrolase, partial [Pyrinomonadaceae bacterium]|nr:alpha/beta fold hydrolase [Pyrinomonadaceae bacterium]
MPIASLQSSPLVPGVSPIEIYYRGEGEGPPLVLLHGGWGYSLNPFSSQIEQLRHSLRIICPDRSGYGRSTRLASDLPADFHYRAAAETLSLLEALDIEGAYFWGHSDGAVIAAIIGFTAPQRVRGLILEAFHYFRMKPGSREFFEALAYRPEALGAELCERFALEFGAADWRPFITGHAKAWLQIALA